MSGPAFPGLRPPRRRRYSPPPARHRVHTRPVDDIEITLAGGRLADPDTPSVRNWTVTAAIPADFDDGGTREETEEVARMWLYAVNPIDGDPLDDLDWLSTDAADLGTAIWAGDETTDAFAEATDLVGGSEPVLLVDTYKVAREWRGTVLTPALAALMLTPFAALGATTAALYACPTGSGDLPAATRRRVQRRIAAMWAHLDFRPFTEQGHLAVMLHTRALREVVKQAADQVPALKSHCA